MNLRGIANSLTQAINANQTVVWQQSTGYTTDASGKRTPTYATSNVQAQVQAIDGGDLKHLDSLNMQGVFRSVYLYGNVAGVVRADQKGGDILQFPQVPGGPVHSWVVTMVRETWPDWCRVIATLQQS